jgi:hypothetical protein
MTSGCVLDAKGILFRKQLFPIEARLKVLPFNTTASRSLRNAQTMDFQQVRNRIGTVPMRDVPDSMLPVDSLTGAALVFELHRLTRPEPCQRLEDRGFPILSTHYG